MTCQNNKMIKSYKPTHIVNFASQNGCPKLEMPLDWYRTNVISSVKLIQSIKLMKFLKRYVHISTPEVYGNTPKNLRKIQVTPRLMQFQELVLICI